MQLGGLQRYTASDHAHSRAALRAGCCTAWAQSAAGHAKMHFIRSPFPFSRVAHLLLLSPFYPGCCYEISLSA